MSHPQSILITGASSGIGEALAGLYARPGVFLALTGRDADRLNGVAKHCESKGARVFAKAVPVTDRAAMAAFLAEADAIAPLDLVIANAGVAAGLPSFHQPVLMEGEDVTREIFSVNMDGVLNTLWPALHIMAERGHGQIALMSSLSGYRGMASAPAYSASKAAVKAYGEALRPRLAEKGLRLSVICPGFVKSRITAKNRFAMPMLMETDIAAKKIRDALARDVGLIAFPWPMRLGSWFLGIIPARLYEALNKRLPRKT